MASAAVSAAAAGFDNRSSTSFSSSSTLQTPGSGTFPSEMRSPMAYSPGFMKKDEALKTPITPPSAYLDFLRNMSPAIVSPMLTGTSSRFNFNEKASQLSCVSTPTTQPALSRNTSYESNASSNTTSSESSAASHITQSASTTRPESPRIVIPPSPFIKPGPRSARTPRRLQIPQSPYSPMSTVNSAHSHTGTPLSAAPWSASFSPRDVEAEINGKPGKVSVRHVVTRTVTYCRTPLEPAPRGKRRKLDGLIAGDKVAEIPSAMDEDTPKKPQADALIKQEVDEKAAAPVVPIEA